MANGFWLLSLCAGPANGITVAGYGRITVEMYEEALANNNTLLLAEYDAALLPTGWYYTTVTPPECVIDPEEG